MKAQIQKFLKEEDGITALEYGILAAIVAVVLIAVIGTTEDGLLGSTFTTIFQQLKDTVTGLGGGSGT